MADEGTGIPVVSIVGKSDSGKTTVVEGVVRALTARGYRVATVKHHVHDIEVDQPGKDSWRHARAGSVCAMISSPSQFVTVRRVDRERTLPELAAAALEAGADILVTEGFRRAGSVRIEVSRRARSDEAITPAGDLFALVTDNDDLDPGGAPAFALDDHEGVAALIEARLLGGAR